MALASFFTLDCAFAEIDGITPSSCVNTRLKVKNKPGTLLLYWTFQATLSDEQLTIDDKFVQMMCSGAERSSLYDWIEERNITNNVFYFISKWPSGPGWTGQPDIGWLAKGQSSQAEIWDNTSMDAQSFAKVLEKNVGESSNVYCENGGRPRRLVGVRSRGDLATWAGTSPKYVFACYYELTFECCPSVESSPTATF